MAPWHVQKIEAGSGDLALDYFPLVITKRPTVEGKQLDDLSLMDYVRRHFGDFVDPALGVFSAAEAADKALWDSSNPLGSVMIFELKLPGNPPGLDKAAVQTSQHAADHWTFTTVYSGRTDVGDHPLCGNRLFGITSAAPLDGCILYTRAVSRFSQATTPEIAKSGAEAGRVFWSSFLGKVAEFIQANGGATASGMLSPTTGNVPWADVQAGFHQPKIPWNELTGVWVSTDKEHRFRLELRGWASTCELIETTKSGKELKMTVPLKVSAEEPISYVVERPNTAKEVLEFYDFADKTQEEVLKANPRPSRLTFVGAGTKLKAQWSGLYVSKDGAGKVKEIKQPGDLKAKAYEFVPQKTP